MNSMFNLFTLLGQHPTNEQPNSSTTSTTTSTVAAAINAQTAAFMDTQSTLPPSTASTNNNANRLSRRPSSSNTHLHFRWRRPSISKQQSAQSSATSSTAQSATNTASTSVQHQHQDSKEPKQPAPPALAPAPDSREEIKKLLRVRDKDRDDGTVTSDADSECSRPMKKLEDKEHRRHLKAASASDLGHAASSSSLVPGSLPVAPSRDIPNAAPFRTKYNLYNPVGPKYYTNVHLVPPNTRAPLSSTFSPSFPPVRTAIGAIPPPASLQPQDSSTRPSASRTPSSSPTPTPSGSQTRLNNGTSMGDVFPPVRSRKVSATAHDNVDMLDGSDPSGKNWHHDSPYEVIGLNGPPPIEARVRWFFSST